MLHFCSQKCINLNVKNDLIQSVRENVQLSFIDTKKGKASYKAAQFQDIFDAGGSKSKGKPKKPNINLGKDRMLEDKIYLEMLTQTVTKIGGGTGFCLLFSNFNHFFHQGALSIIKQEW